MKEFLILHHSLSIMDCPSELKELLKVIYGLSGSEAEVLTRVCEEEWRADALAEELGKDRSTVQRYLSKLRSANLVSRETVNEPGKRGRHYIYMAPEPQELKKQIRQRMKEWENDKLEVLEEV